MSIAIQILSITIIIFISIALIRMLQLRIIKEKYMWVWLFLDLLAFIFTLWPGGLAFFSNLLGFKVPANIIFFVVTAVLILMEIYQAMAISRLEEDRRRITEELAILRHEIEELR